MLTCLQAAAESPGVSMRERVNGTPLRGVGGTQVSASTLPQGRWRSDAYETRQRRIHAPQGLMLLCRLSLYLAFSLYSGTASLSEQAVMDTMGDTRNDLAVCKYVFFFLVDVVLYQGLEQQKRQADMSHLTVCTRYQTS